MSNFKSYVVTSDGTFYFTDKDSHKSIIRLMQEKGITVTDEGLGKDYICMEVRPELNYSVILDAPTERPKWFTMKMWDNLIELTKLLQKVQLNIGPITRPGSLLPEDFRKYKAEHEIITGEFNQRINDLANRYVNEHNEKLKELPDLNSFVGYIPYTPKQEV